MRKAMRAKWILLLLMAALPALAGAQVGFVTVTGSNANYANGTLTANFQTPPNTSQSSYSGQRFPFTQSATLNGSGQWSLQVADNTTLVPAGSQWQLNLCSQQASYLPPPTCFAVTVPVTCIGNASCSGSALNMSSSFAGAPPPASGGSLTALFAFQGYGDSYMLGQGATNPATGSGFAQVAKTIPSVPPVNYGLGGLNSDTINFDVWTLVQPSPQQPSAYILNGGNNDRGNCGTSFGCLTNYKEEISSSIARATIPNQERVMGSTCMQTSGTWTADNGLYTLPAPTYYLNPGTAVSASGSGAILTCTVPSRSASTQVGLNFQVTNAQTGTFTVTVDGVPQIDKCSGTTTFTSAPCAGQNLLTLTTTIFRQEFTGTPGTSHTVAITTTNAAKVNVTAVDTITATPQANSNYVPVVGPAPIFDAGGIYDAAIAAVSNQFTADGARVVFADLQSTSNPGPGVNATTDIATTATPNCSLSASASHPNDVCGYFHLAQTVVNATKAAGWNIFGTPQSSSGGFDSTTIPGMSLGAGDSGTAFMLINRATFGNDPRGNAFISGASGHGIDFYCGATGFFTSGLCGGYTPVGVPFTTQGTAIASATTIAPTAAGVFHVTGTIPIVTMTPPSGCTTSALDCELKLIPDALGSTTTGGNIISGTTFVVGKLLIEIYDPATALWYPSY